MPTRLRSLRRPALLTGLAALLVLGSGCLPGKLVPRKLIEAPSSPGALLLRDVHVFPATGRELLPHHDVLVRDGRIESITPTGTVSPDDLQVIEGGGRTLLPGFIDVHTHLMANPAPPWAPARMDPEHNLAAWLYAGVTTIYDLGGNAKTSLALRRRVDSGALPGPRILFTDSAIMIRGGHPVPFVKTLPWPVGWLYLRTLSQIDGPQDAEAAVAALQAKGVDFIKVMCDAVPPDSPSMDEETLRAVVEAAHRRGLKVFAHVGRAADAVLAVRAGADVLAHGPYQSVLSDEEVAEIARAGVPVAYTLATWQTADDLLEGRFVPSALDREIAPPEVLDSFTGAAGARLAEAPVFGETLRKAQQHSAEWPRAVRRLHEAGVPLLVGTDSPMVALVAGASFHRELQRLHLAGVPAVEVLLGATSRAARLLTSEPEFGTIEPGKIADMVLLDGDPLEDITATSRIHLVVRHGRVVERVPPR